LLSHLLTIPPGPHILSDILLSSPILMEEGQAAPAGAGVGGGAGGAAFEFGVDPNIDPELALALRMSMEEEKQRQERIQAEQKPTEGQTSTAPASKPATEDVVMGNLHEFQEELPPQEYEGYDEDVLLAQALAMSLAHGC